MDTAHLRPEARELDLLPAAERLARIPANRWIDYTRASEAIMLLCQPASNFARRMTDGTWQCQRRCKTPQKRRLKIPQAG